MDPFRLDLAPSNCHFLDVINHICAPNLYKNIPKEWKSGSIWQITFCINGYTICSLICLCDSMERSYEQKHLTYNQYIY